MSSFRKSLAFCLLALSLMLPPSEVQSQCIIDSILVNPGIYPTELSQGCVGAWYDDTVQIAFSTNLFFSGLLIPFDSFRVSQAWSTNPGLNYQCFNSPSCYIYPTGTNSLPRSCVRISGVPQFQTNLGDSIFIEVESRITMFGSLNIVFDTLATKFDVLGAPSAAFSYAQNGTTFSFTNNSTNAGFFQWDFGDGSQSSALDPVHTYSSQGAYQVCLVAAGDNFFCPIQDSVCQWVNVGVSRDLEFIGLEHYPNPSEGRIFIRGIPESTIIEVSDIRGKIVYQTIAEQKTVLIDLPDLEPSMYFVRLTSNGASKVIRVIVSGK